MLWRNFLRRDRVDQEWREEMETHLQMLIDSFLEQGLTPDEARHAALKRAGNLTSATGGDLSHERDSVGGFDFRRYTLCRARAAQESFVHRRSRLDAWHWELARTPRSSASSIASF